MVAPYRVDVSNKTNEKYIDIDPMLFVLDRDSGFPHPSGAVGYHQKFADRTTSVPGYENVDFDVTVSDLRKKVSAGLVPLEAAPSQVLSALQHMVGKFRVDFMGEGD